MIEAKNRSFDGKISTGTELEGDPLTKVRGALA